MLVCRSGGGGGCRCMNNRLQMSMRISDLLGFSFGLCCHHSIIRSLWIALSIFLWRQWEIRYPVIAYSEWLNLVPSYTIKNVCSTYGWRKFISDNRRYFNLWIWKQNDLKWVPEILCPVIINGRSIEAWYAWNETISNISYPMYVALPRPKFQF